MQTQAKDNSQLQHKIPQTDIESSQDNYYD